MNEDRIRASFEDLYTRDEYGDIDQKKSVERSLAGHYKLMQTECAWQWFKAGVALNITLVNHD